jgi:hypothetical protein
MCETLGNTLVRALSRVQEIRLASDPGYGDAPDVTERRVGLDMVDRGIREDMLEIVKCKVLSVVTGRMDAYFLRFVQPKYVLFYPCSLYILTALPTRPQSLPRTWVRRLIHNLP